MRALVAVDQLPFVHPHFWVETVYDDDDGMHEWHEASDFAAMPTTPDVFALAEHLTTRSKIGGHPVLNDDGAEPLLGSDGEWMEYAIHLGAEFFDVTFGDAGSLHVWLSRTTGEGGVVTDSA